MFYLIGLGLGDPKDITLKGLEIVKNCDEVYLESYTSLMSAGKEELTELYGKEVKVADREFVEQGMDHVISKGKEQEVALLVIGDPLSATTHSDILLRARSMNVDFKIVHNSSIMTAVAVTGLQLYSFGETVSIPFWTDTWKPDSFYDKICANKERGLHTLCLLDIKVKEPNLESMMRGKVIYDPPRFMSVSQAVMQLSKILEERRKEGCKEGHLNEETWVVGLARIGTNDQRVSVRTLKEMEVTDLGKPLHSLVICGKLHPLEIEFLNIYKESLQEL